MPAFNYGRHFVISFIAVVIMAVVMSLLDQPLRTSVAPYGIISFELVGDWQSSWVLLSSWDQSARLSAAMMLGLDYLFLLLYPWCMYCACRATAAAFQAPSLWRDMGGVVAVLVWLAVPLDAMENFALWRILNEVSGEFWPRLALFSAIPKFAVVIMGIAYVLCGQLARLVVSKRSVR